MDLKLADAGTVIDQFGNETTISILMDGQIPVAVIHSTDSCVRYNDDAIHQEHVIQSIDIVKHSDETWHDDYATQISCPSRSTMKYRMLKGDTSLPDDVDIANDVRADYEESDGFDLVKWGEQGAEVPTGKSDAFYRGVELAKKRYHRIVRNGKLTGKPRSW